MPIHQRGKLVAGVIAAVMALTLTSAPASAGTVNVTVTSGTLELRSPSGTLIHTINLANHCPLASNRVTTTNGTAITMSLYLTYAAHIGTQNYALALTITMTGSYTGSAPVHGVTGTTSLSIEARRSTGPGSCSPDPEFGLCLVTASNITWAGSVSSADIHTLATADTIVFSGGNAVFNTVVTGTVASCGQLTALNNGRVVLTNVALTV